MHAGVEDEPHGIGAKSGDGGAVFPRRATTNAHRSSLQVRVAMASVAKAGRSVPAKSICVTSPFERS